MSKRIGCRSHVHGQALTEFLVVALVLVPLYLLMPLIAKYQDIAYQTLMASRYVAFDAAVNNELQNTWKNPAQLAGEVRRRFFSTPDAPIKSNDTAGNFRAHRNAFWNGPKNEPLIADFDTDVAVGFGQNRSSAQAGSLMAASDGDPFNRAGNTEVETHIADQLGLKPAGVFTGSVAVKLANLSTDVPAYRPFDNINLSVTRRTSVSIDGWAAADSEQVVKRIDSKLLVPGTLLRPVRPLAAALVGIAEVGQVQAPRLGELEFWSDVVPPDRLK
ncbi:hypothetical protein [Massilia rhizosphaerae]|uniref:hypothetical protein n=1 Tax=Massilia rhizosphaerae TaxID=2784389 RepID=UPI0018DB2A89|nr:hypothetical protein [Massilia rhizosphaerae]